MSPPTSNPQKARKGMSRIVHAATYSIHGLCAAWQETAFRQEAIASCFLIPLAFVIGRTWLEMVILVGCLVAVMVVELLNTGIESAIDRIGPQWHDLSKRAKDIGSAAVFLSLVFALGVWGSLLYLRWIA